MVWARRLKVNYAVYSLCATSVLMSRVAYRPVHPRGYPTEGSPVSRTVYIGESAIAHRKKNWETG